VEIVSAISSVQSLGSDSTIPSLHYVVNSTLILVVVESMKIFVDPFWGRLKYCMGRLFKGITRAQIIQ
jgi:hypothetical protein